MSASFETTLNETNVKVEENEEMEVEDEEESEDDGESYRKMIERNWAERDAFLKSLEIGNDVEALNDISKKVAKKREVKKTIQKKNKPTRNITKEVLPRREPSRRIRKLKARSEKAIKLKVEKDLIKQEEEEMALMKDERLLGPLKLEEQPGADVIFSNLEHKGNFNPDLNLKESPIESFTDQIRCMRLFTNMRVVKQRIQSAYVHPTTAKCLSFLGCTNGELGIWDSAINDNTGVIKYKYHKAPINCITTDIYDSTKLLTTSHDGTVCYLDLEKNKCDAVYATDFDDRVTHLTWHDQIDAQTYLIAHGAGKVGKLDLRTPEVIEDWEECFPRSCRTVQHNPANKNHILVSSATGGCIIYDIRKSASTPLSTLEHPKGLTSAFFSPNGRRVLTTCNDDKLRVFEVDADSSAKLKVSLHHNNFTGRWLTVFRAMWFPQRSDVFHVGALLQPRMIQIFNDNGDIIASLKDKDMTTIQSVQACHPTLPIMIGANSTGRVHLFSPPGLFNY